MAELVAAMGQIGDMRLLVMVSLLIADELSEVTRQLDDPRKTSEAARSTDTKVDAQAAPALESSTARIGGMRCRETMSTGTGVYGYY